MFKGQLTQVRQQGFGVQYYIWRSQDDGRVRDDHQFLDDKIFRWDQTPPGGYHPGQEIGCRCWAEPIMNPDGTPTLWEGTAQYVTSQIPDAPKVWDDIDFLYHFAYGNGRTVTLAEIGHLGAIIDASRLLIFKRFNKQIEEKAKEIQNGSFSDNFERSYPFIDVQFSHGDAVVKGEFVGQVIKQGKTLVISGTVVYEFNDVFTDPSDYRDIRYGTSDPEAVSDLVLRITEFGGTLYNVTGGWHTKLEGIVYIADDNK